MAERLANAENECAALAAKVQVLEAPEEEVVVQPEAKEQQVEGCASTYKKRKSSNCCSGGGDSISKMIKNFLTKHIVAADEDDRVSTQEMMAAFKDRTNVDTNLTAFSMELSKQISKAFPLAGQQRKGAFRGYYGIKMTD